MNLGAGEWFDPTRCIHEPDLADEAVWAERDDTLGHLVAEDHAKDGQDQVHSSSTLVLHVGRVEHPLLDEGMPESNVLLRVQLGEVVVAGLTLGHFEASDDLIELL